MKRSKQMTASDYKDFLLEKAEPKLDYWMNKIINEKLINPSLVYGYFPCGRDGNNLNVYDKDHQSLLGNFLLPSLFVTTFPPFHKDIFVWQPLADTPINGFVIKHAIKLCSLAT